MPMVRLHLVAGGRPPEDAVEAAQLLGVLGPAPEAAAILEEDVLAEAREGPIEVPVRAGQEEVVPVDQAEDAPLGGCQKHTAPAFPRTNPALRSTGAAYASHCRGVSRVP